MEKEVKKINRLYLIITVALMDSVILAQSIMFLTFDIAHKPEALVNYVVTFIVLCMTSVLATHYLSAIPVGDKPNKFYYGVIVALFLYAFSYTVFYTIPHDPSYKALMTVMIVVSYCLAYVITLLYGLYFVQFYSMSEKYKRIMRIFLWVSFFIYVVITVISPIFDLIFYIDSEGYVIYPKTSYIGDLYAVFMFCFSVFFILRSKQTRSTKMALLSYDIYAMIFFVIDMQPRDKYDITIDSSIAFGILLSIYTVFLKIYVKDKIDLAEKQAELVEQKTQIMISQIQPHFLYNTLSAIYTLCDDDPKLAQKSIKNFSAYLRKNMNSLDKNECVPFKEELEHTKTYLSIEKLRFQDLLNIEFDIDYEDFLLPALSLQPIVENAVKYGVRSRENGGTVRISTCKKNDKIYISVTDNGKGFNVNKPADDDRIHVGIENTRHRIKTMCGGEMTITSIPAVGTEVTIVLEDNK